MSFVELHESFEARNADIAESEADYEHDRRARWQRSHGSLDGYRAQREFPCPGVLRKADVDEHGMATIVCDVCGYGTTARLTTSTGAASW